MDILTSRLSNQQLSTKRFKKPEEIVKWFGAMQAQDYPGALWEIGLRLPNSTAFEIEKSIEKRKFIRTWPMRGTLHFVPAEDAKWMLNLMTPRIVKGFQSYYAKMGLTDKIFQKSKDIVEKALQGGQQMTRPELYKILAEGIRIKGMRGYFIVGYLAQKAFICFGPRKGKQQTFVLFDEWIKKSRKLEGNKALSEIAVRYFQSHGPATIHDFAWWSGLTMKEVKAAAELANLESELLGGKSYYFVKHNAMKSLISAHLLPMYDEFLIAYKDRSASIHQDHKKHFANKNGIYSPPVMINGQAAGFWNKHTVKKRTTVKTRLFRALSLKEKTALNRAIWGFERFVN